MKKQLSRLVKATFEACLGLFRQNMKTLGRLGWLAETPPPREAHRATSKDVPLTLVDKSNTGLRKMHERGAPQAACPTHEGILVLGETGRKQVFFSWSDGGLGIGTDMDWVISVMPFTGFSTSSTLTLWILSEHSKPQPAWCALPLILYSTQHLHLFICRNSCEHSPFVMRLLSWMVCARSCQPTLRGRVVQEGVSFKADSMADLAAKKVEWWRQNEDNLPHWVGAVKMVLLLQPTSAAAERVFSLLWAVFSDQQ